MKLLLCVRSGLLVGFVMLIAGCGGAGSTPSPAPNGSGDPYGGQGRSFQFDQKVNFTVIVPPAAAPLASRVRRRSAVNASRRTGNAAATTSTNPYVSPNVASVSIVVGSVNGTSVQDPPSTTVVDVTCVGTSGCSVPIQGVAAAKGADLFTVETFSGPNGSGNPISSSSIPVTVPSTQATSFGGTALTVGGFVESLSLTADIPQNTFVVNTSQSAALAVNALDPAGAVIIGNTILANPIAVQFAPEDQGNFSFAGGTSTTIAGPSRVAFTFDGRPVVISSVTANSVDYNGLPISTSLTLPVAPAPTMKPTAPPAAPPQSLYLYDGENNRMIEYSGVNDLEGGGNVVARRAFDVAQPPATTSTLNCTSFNTPPVIAAGFAVGPDGTIYVQTICVDATGTLGYVFAYGPTATDTVSPAGVATPPIPTVIPIALGANFLAPNGIKIDRKNNTLIASYTTYSSTGYSANTPAFYVVSLANPTVSTANFGSTCIGLVGTTAPCVGTTVPQTVYNPVNIPFDFALDGMGSVLVPVQEPPNPPEPTSEQYSTQTAVVALPESQSNSAPVAKAALSGYSTDLAGGGGISIATDAGSLYSLVDANNAITSPGGMLVDPGLSGCPAPSADAPANTLDANFNCNTGSFLVDYLAIFRNILPTFANSGAMGQDLSTAPDAMIGGDATGFFGSGPPIIPGDFLAVSNGYAFIIDYSPKDGTLPPEIQVYNTNGVEKFHTDIEPFQSISFPQINGNYSVFPVSIAIAPTGTAMTGTGLLLRAPRAFHDLRAYSRSRRIRHDASSRSISRKR